MKRLHLHVRVKDLKQSLGFYATLFGTDPVVTKPDYAKWQLDDPAVNFAISTTESEAGLDHVGIQTETQDELTEIAQRLQVAGEKTFNQKAAACCYVMSDKSWVEDPSGVRWETFFTHNSITVYGNDTATSQEEADKLHKKTVPVSCC